MFNNILDIESWHVNNVYLVSVTCHITVTSYMKGLTTMKQIC
jgi:hypothetical protein